MELDPWFGGRRGTAYDPFSLDVWDPFYFPGAIWDVQTPRYRYEGQGGQDTITAAHTQVDWKETPDAHIFKADLPGLKKEDIKIHVEDGRVLEISGERSKEDVEKNDKWHRVERQHGSFLRRFRLPENAKVDEVKAGMENGVLTVTVPKVQQPKPQIKSIDISG